MKNIVFILAIIFTSKATAQEPCQEFIDKMIESIEIKNTEISKTFMKGFVVCKEESLGSDNPIIKELESISYFFDKLPNKNLIVKLKNDNIKVIDERFNTIFSFTDADLNYINYTDGFYRMYNKRSKTVYLYNDTGKSITDKGFAFLGDFTNGYAVFVESQSGIYGGFRYGYVNKSGHLKYMDKYSFVLPFRSKMAVVVLPYRKYNFIDENFNEILKNPIELKYCSPIYEGVVTVQFENGRYGTIDRKGIINVMNKNIQILSPFNQGVAVAVLNGKFGLINLQFKEITGFIYDKLSNKTEYNNKPILCSGDNKLTNFCKSISLYSEYLDTNGLIEFRNNYAKFNSDLFQVQKGNQISFFVNQKGECVKNCQNTPKDHPRAK